MRYDKLITFVKLESRYDADAGEYIETTTEVQKRANITETGAERQQVEYGNVRSDRYTIRLQRAYTEDFDRILIDGVPYVASRTVRPSDRHTIEVERWAAM